MTDKIVRCRNCNARRSSRIDPREIRLSGSVKCRVCGHTSFVEIPSADLLNDPGST